MRVHVAVCDEKIFPAVVVIIQEARSEPQILGVNTESGLHAGIVECAIAVVAVQNCDLVGEVGPRDVKPAVTIVIANCNAHPGECDAILIEGTAGRNRHFGEGAVLVVVIQQAGRGIAGDVDIRPAIVVEVG